MDSVRTSGREGFFHGVVLCVSNIWETLINDGLFNIGETHINMGLSKLFFISAES